MLLLSPKPCVIVTGDTATGETVQIGIAPLGLATGGSEKSGHRKRTRIKTSCHFLDLLCLEF